MNRFRFLNRSIKTRVVILVSLLLVVSMAFITLFAVSTVYRSMSAQTYALLENRSHALHARIEQRLLYLIENTAILTKNELMVNALTDADGRNKYLPSLVENFMLGKDVVSLNIVDFDGKPIFKTQENIPLYNESEELRDALAMGNVTYYVEKYENEDRFVVVSPIEYYGTTQGAAIVVFDFAKIIDNNLAGAQNVYYGLYKGDRKIYSHNFIEGLDYQMNSYDVSELRGLFYQLGLSFELGVDSKVYTAPVEEVIYKLLLFSIVFIVIGVLFARALAKSITTPILTLYSRVTSPSSSHNNFCSPLGTHDELEALAKAFDKRTLMLQHQAEHDALTSLPNRVLFMQRVWEKIKEAETNKLEFAVLFIDLDHFKEVNDSFGHDFGDKLLLIIGKYLNKLLTEKDSAARMGGDEFAILLSDAAEIKSVVGVLEEVMKLFKEPFTIDHHQFYITCSIGVAIYPSSGTTPEVLLKHADAAMYKAKDEGRNNYKFYTDDMSEKAYDRITLETEIRQGILNHEFEVYYQPQVDMQDESIIGMEALVRWNHPQKGLVSPAIFIPLAEDTGLIIEIDKQVMRDSMRQFKEWMDDGYKVGTLSVNLSMIQLNHEDFLDFVQETLLISKLSADKIMFEVTETQVMRNPENAIIMLQQIKDLGIRLAVDDFGTGHSSLSYLKQLPIDKLKIDQSFTRDVLVDEDDAKLTRAIISIANNLRLEVIAEGVETNEQAEFLMENGCVEAQGYYYYKPQNVQTITEILANKV